jgi:hypothetical protein
LDYGAGTLHYRGDDFGGYIGPWLGQDGDYLALAVGNFDETPGYAVKLSEMQIAFECKSLSINNIVQLDTSDSRIKANADQFFTGSTSWFTYSGCGQIS